MKHKTELLLPVGSMEMLQAAIAGGADAVYLGLKKFNARGRAKNFTYSQLKAAIELCHKKNMKVFVTLNTLIKNKEINELIEVLEYLNILKPDALIIQDWGVYQIIKKFYPQIPIHASTQIGAANSLAAEFLHKKKFERVILARELTLPEIAQIKKKSKIALELFIHGSLCYSFSGHCLFSSFLGGMSANRGLCKQPCRKKYLVGKNKETSFSLKDLELMDCVKSLRDLEIGSLKVEGRMKSPDYVYRVARNYKELLSSPKPQIPYATDFAREKTGYFLSGSISNAFTKDQATGQFLGSVTEIFPASIVMFTEGFLEKGDSIRINDFEDENTSMYKIKEVSSLSQDVSNPLRKVQIFVTGDFKIGDKVYLTGKAGTHFTGDIKSQEIHLNTRLIQSRQGEITKSMWNRSFELKNPKRKIFFRVDSLEWLEFLKEYEHEKVILRLTKSQLDKAMDKTFAAKLKNYIIQLPLFISEGGIKYYRSKVQALIELGVETFLLNQIFQKQIFNSVKKINIWASENIYVQNLATLQMLEEEGVENFIYPLESDFENMFALKKNKALVPIYFKPALFTSRMPLENEKANIKDGDLVLQTFVRDGIREIVPVAPVSITQYLPKLEKHQFSQFLIDLSYIKPSKEALTTIMEAVKTSTKIEGSKQFNFKKGLW